MVYSRSFLNVGKNSILSLLTIIFVTVFSCNYYEIEFENEIPVPVELAPIVYSNGNFTINWSMNSENDFKVYNLKESLFSDMSDETLIFSSTSKHDTVFIVENIIEGDERFYQVTVLDTGNLSSRSNIAYATAPVISYQKEFGGQDNDIAYSVQQTADEGLIIAGRIDSWGNGGIDGWLIKTNIEGHEEWNYTFGGENSELFRKVKNTSDGGYILTGITNSFGYGSSDIWLVKVNQEGLEEWQYTFGGADGDWGMSVEQTMDDGFIVVGHTLSFGAGFYDIYMVKTDAFGNEEWHQTFGGTEEDFGYSVLQTSEGGYVVLGFTVSFGSGSRDVWLIKTDAQGNMEWDKTFGGSERDEGYSVQQTTDGGYIITGYTESFGNGQYDVWLIKTDSQGQEEWDKTFGGSVWDEGYSVQQTTEGGYIITGYTISYGNGAKDIWLVKTDNAGNEEWNYTFGGINNEAGQQILQTFSGGYVIVGYTESRGSGQKDVKLIKTSPAGI
jgi:hypothetical protein